jgi:hypothetical protein
MKNLYKEQFQLLKRETLNFPWTIEDVYANFLAQTYYYVGHSTRLLCSSAARMDVKQEKLHKRFLAHTSEEKSHHLLALHDLQCLGGKLEKYPELPSTRMLYETQYYKIEHQDPTALLGYIIALEGLAVHCGPSIFDKVSKCFGPKPASFLKVHVGEDPDHLEKAFEVVESLDSRQVQLVETNFIQSCVAYTSFLEGIVGRSEKLMGQLKRAA